MHWSQRHCALLRAAMIAILALLSSRPARAEVERVAYTLPNGLQVRLVNDRKADEVVILLGARAGIFEEPAGKPHLAHVCEHLLAHAAKPGTAEADAFPRWFERNQANGETTADLMYFDIHVPSDQRATALRLQAARLFAPTFTPEALAREAPRALAEATHLEQAAEVLTSKFAGSAFVQAAFFGAKNVALKASTRSYSIDDARAFHARVFRPERAMLAIAGNIDPAAVRKEVDALFSQNVTAVKPIADAPKLKPGHHSARWDLATRHLLVAWPAPPSSHADHPAATLAAAVLTQDLATDPAIAAQTTFPHAENTVAGVFYLDVPIKRGADIDAIERKLWEHVARLSQRNGGADGILGPMRGGLIQMLGNVDLDAMALPPNVSRSLALGNVELGALRYTLAWGSLPAYAKRLEAVEPPMLHAVAGRWLDASKATVVRLEPER